MVGISKDINYSYSVMKKYLCLLLLYCSLVLLFLRLYHRSCQVSLVPAADNKIQCNKFTVCKLSISSRSSLEVVVSFVSLKKVTGHKFTEESSLLANCVMTETFSVTSSLGSI